MLQEIDIYKTLVYIFWPIHRISYDYVVLFAQVVITSLLRVFFLFFLLLLLFLALQKTTKVI